MERQGLLSRIRSRLLASVHCALGVYHRRRKHLHRARESFQRAVDCWDRSFVAHLNLGRIYIRDQEHALALGELQRAREIDIERFNRVSLTGEEFYLLFERICEIRRAGRTEDYSSQTLRMDLDMSEEVEDLPYGDFISRDEFERFSLLPPIAISEVEEIDWAELGRQLAEEE